MTRRRLLASGRQAALLAGTLPLAATPNPTPPDDSFRYRWSTIGELFRKAKADRARQGIEQSAYVAILRLLREEELVIFHAASQHQFKDIIESNYWHRSMLKFQSEIEVELLLLGERSRQTGEKR